MLISGVVLVAGTLARADTAERRAATGLAGIVREVTAPFQDVAAAEAAGYVRVTPCVSGPQEGAMGIHYGKVALIGDGQLDARAPELLIYEQTPSGQLQLLGVEYLVLAQAWDANHTDPPTLEGQLFHYTGSPNRYRLPAFYALHVWAWKSNPHGTFVDWHPNVTCDHADEQ